MNKTSRKNKLRQLKALLCVTLSCLLLLQIVWQYQVKANEVAPNHAPTQGEYFYKQLNPLEQSVYLQVLAQADKLTDPMHPEVVKVKIPDGQSMTDRILFAIFRDHPEYFWVNISKLAWINTGVENGEKLYELTLKIANEGYFYEGYDPNTLQATREQVEKTIQEIIAKAPQEPEAKLLYIMDWIALNNVYNRNGLGATNFSRSAASIFLSANDADKGPVCYGYATGLKVLLDRFGFENAYIEGWAYNDRNVPHGEQHAWNYVKYEGKWYALDATWDDPAVANKPALRKYFMVGSDTETETITVLADKKQFKDNHVINEDKSSALRSFNFTYPELSKDKIELQQNLVEIYQADGTLYHGASTLAEALDYLLANPIKDAKIKLFQDFTVEANKTYNIDEKLGTLALDLGGYTVKTSSAPLFTVANDGSLEIQNSTAATSEISGPGTIIENNGKLGVVPNVRIISNNTSPAVSPNEAESLEHSYIVTTGNNKQRLNAYLVTEPKFVDVTGAEVEAKATYEAAKQGQISDLENLLKEATQKLQAKFRLNANVEPNVPKEKWQDKVKWQLKATPAESYSQAKPLTEVATTQLANGTYQFVSELFGYPLQYEIAVSGVEETSPTPPAEPATLEIIDAKSFTRSLTVKASEGLTDVSLWLDGEKLAGNLDSATQGQEEKTFLTSDFDKLEPGKHLQLKAKSADGTEIISNEFAIKPATAKITVNLELSGDTLSQANITPVSANLATRLDGQNYKEPMTLELEQGAKEVEVNLYADEAPRRQIEYSVSAPANLLYTSSMFKGNPDGLGFAQTYTLKLKQLVNSTVNVQWDNQDGDAPSERPTFKFGNVTVQLPLEAGKVVYHKRLGNSRKFSENGTEVDLGSVDPSYLDISKAGDASNFTLGVVNDEGETSKQGTVLLSEHNYDYTVSGDEINGYDVTFTAQVSAKPELSQADNELTVKGTPKALVKLLDAETKQILTDDQGHELTGTLDETGKFIFTVPSSWQVAKKVVAELIEEHKVKQLSDELLVMYHVAEVEPEPTPEEPSPEPEEPGTDPGVEPAPPGGETEQPERGESEIDPNPSEEHKPEVTVPEVPPVVTEPTVPVETNKPITSATTARVTTKVSVTEVVSKPTVVEIMTNATTESTLSEKTTNKTTRVVERTTGSTKLDKHTVEQNRTNTSKQGVPRTGESTSSYAVLLLVLLGISGMLIKRTKQEQ